MTELTESAIGTKRHIGRTGPRVDPKNELSALIRFVRESARLSRPQLSSLSGISVASIHTLEHERTPRAGELDTLCPVLFGLTDLATWTKLGGLNYFVPPTAKKRTNRTKANKSVETVETVETDKVA